METCFRKLPVAAALLLWCSNSLYASPIVVGLAGPYSLSDWALTNINADGSVSDPTSNIPFSLTGGNNGTGNDGTTDFTVLIAGTGSVAFTFSYETLDAPGFDFAGYILDGAFTQLADTADETGTRTVSVSSGQHFGFRVATIDNQGEPGILTISAFDAPAAAPEPATAMTVIICTIALAVLSRHRR